jgi:hypothetical protein
LSPPSSSSSSRGLAAGFIVHALEDWTRGKARSPMIARRVGFVPSRSGVSTRIIKSSGGSSGCGRVERTLRLTTIYVCLFSPHIPRRSGPTDSTNCNGTLNSGLRRGHGYHPGMFVRVGRKPRHRGPWQVGHRVEGRQIGSPVFLLVRRNGQ